MPNLALGHAPARAVFWPSNHGKPLPDLLKQKMENVFQTDFSEVRIHTGQQAKAMGSIAFTWGNEIYIDPGHYNPSSQKGQQLIAHELTHVIQQSEGRAKSPYNSGVTVLLDQA